MSIKWKAQIVWFSLENTKQDILVSIVKSHKNEFVNSVESQSLFDVETIS